MNQAVDSIAIQIIQTIIIVLVTMFLLLIILVIIRRLLLKKWAKNMHEAEEKVLPTIYDYLDGDLTIDQFSKNLQNRFEVITAFKNTNLLIDNFEGEQRTKLKELLDLEQFNQYFKKGLRSASTIKLAQACMYFEKKDRTEEEVISRLKSLQFHDYPVIQYAAALALINTNDQDMRDDALRIFLYSDGIASMAINDVIYKYCNLHEKPNQAANTLFRYISDTATPVSNAESIVRMISTLGFYQLADDLVTIFKFPYQNDERGLLTSALIDTLSDISNENILSMVDESKTWKSEHIPVRLATAKWVRMHYSKDLDPILVLLANDPDLDVRINAQMALLKSHELKHLNRHIQLQYRQEWIEIKETGGSYVDTD